MIIAEQLTKFFGRRAAVDKVDLSLGQGEIVGLVGANGSGKTTLLKLAAGFLEASSGTIRVLGLNPFAERSQLMRRVRFAFAPPPLYENLTAWEHLGFLGNLGRDATKRIAVDKIETALRQVQLLDRSHDRVSTFSFGMRQRLGLAQALLPMPELLILDEPTEGLDPLAILELRAILRALRRDRGVTILLSSHLLVEVDQLVDRLALLDAGEVRFCGSPAELCAQSKSIRIKVSSSAKAQDALRRSGISCRVLPAETNGAGADSSILDCEPDSLDLPKALSILRDSGSELLEFYEHRPSLEAALLHRLRGEDDEGVHGR